jgi:hypothetical protein
MNSARHDRAVKSEVHMNRSKRRLAAAFPTPLPVTSEAVHDGLDADVAAPNPAPDIGDDQIRARAYDIYQRRMRSGEPGDALTDWLQAERELRTPPPTAAPQIVVKARSTGLEARIV